MAIIVWSGAGAASTGSNWAGGIAPAAGDTAQFDATSVSNCTWDIAAVAGIDVRAAFTGAITLSVITFVSGALTIVTAGTQDFITSGFNLWVDGAYSVTGVGNGITHSAGGTLYWGGDVVQRVGTLISPVRLSGEKATPTLAKTHITDMPSFNPQPREFTVGQNQTMQVAPAVRVGNITLESGTTVYAAGSGRSLIIDDGIFTPENCTWNGANTGDLVVNFLTPVVAPADYGNANVGIQNTTTISGVYLTLGEFRFGSQTITQTYTMSGSVICGSCKIGSGIFTNRAAILIQQAGSLLSVSGNMLIQSDDTFQTNIWMREAGVLDTAIGGALTVSADAALDFTGDTSTITVTGVVSIDVDASANFGLTTLIHMGDIKSAGFSNIFNILESQTSDTPIVLLDDISANTWRMTGSGGIDLAGNGVSLRADGPQLVGADSITWISATGDIKFLTSAGVGAGLVTIPGANYQANTEIRRSGAGLRTLRLLGDVAFGNIVPRDFTFDCNGYTANGVLFQDTVNPYRLELNGGAVSMSSDVDMSDAGSEIVGPGTINAQDMLHSGGSLSMLGITMAIRDYVPVLGPGFALVGGGVFNLTRDFNPANVLAPQIDTSGTTITFTGSGAQVYNIGNSLGGPKRVSVSKSAGTLNINQDQGVGTELDLNAANGSATVVFINTITYNFKKPISRGVSGNKTSITSSVPASKVTYNFITAESPAMRYVGWQDSDVQGVIQNVDTITGSNDGNNTLAGVAGLFFASFPTNVSIGRIKIIGNGDLQGITKRHHPLIGT